MSPEHEVYPVLVHDLLHPKDMNEGNPYTDLEYQNIHDQRQLYTRTVSILSKIYQNNIQYTMYTCTNYSSANNYCLLVLFVFHINNMNLTMPDSQKIVVMNQLIHNAQNVKSTTTQLKSVYSVHVHILEIKQITLFVKCVKLIYQ